MALEQRRDKKGRATIKAVGGECRVSKLKQTKRSLTSSFFELRKNQTVLYYSAFYTSLLSMGSDTTLCPLSRLKAPIHSLTQSCDPISCCGKPMERTNEIGLEMVSLVHSTGFAEWLIGSYDLHFFFFFNLPLKKKNLIHFWVAHTGKTRAFCLVLSN